ncbi:transporter, putative [Plasmodium berghei]|uniref:Transporter, putative n=2 Tax=Plasmodium berghei TaxID=5821 RepID=A0A509AFQ2_PLABA|nr:transporter, putative [Plasmodium berghei ANKA]CXH93967.1 transporter, putative [Plasmodium berghei]SCL90844.1 transporter, putative [Plasmodium berghei]SCM15367.1 transporter, putative [Plasmodium berghei]SCM17160.1 transporter, putative [Plasmodium berghei]SCN22178.1 transporter, putative [Plasmodium berghei]|eukprot:XP_034419951.1 transporter, putative [Plasmodium berghei ANKA]
MLPRVKCRFEKTESSNFEENTDNHQNSKNGKLLDSENVSMKKIRSVLYDEAMNYSETNTYYKSSNIHNYNNINAYINYIKKTNYTRSYEQENIYNEALLLYNNRNAYIRNAYRNDEYLDIKRNLKKGKYFGDNDDDDLFDEKNDTNQINKHKDTHEYDVGNTDNNEINKNNLKKKKIEYEQLYKERKKERAMKFAEKYGDLFYDEKDKIINDNGDLNNNQNNRMGFIASGNGHIQKNNKNQGSSTNILNDLLELHSMKNTGSFCDEKETNFLETLVKLRYAPEQISKLSDLFENPRTLKNVNINLLKWLDMQLNKGYWLERISLFLLGLAISIGVGNIETIWILMTTWHGVVFLLPYVLCYMLVCHPILMFELYSGQLVRSSSPFIFYKLLKPCASIGFVALFLCLLSSYIHTYRTAAEYLIYLINSFKHDLPWKLTQNEIDFCTQIKKDAITCLKHRPLCLFSKSISSCVPNNIGKAFLIYHDKFFPNNNKYTFLLNLNKKKNSINIFSNSDSYIDKDSFVFLLFCNLLATFFQLLGMTNFAFSVALVLLLLGFLSITKFIALFNLNSVMEAYFYILKMWKFSYLYTYSSIWSQCMMYALYEMSIGMGIYSSLATKTRIGSNLAFDGQAIVVGNSVISILVFFSAVAIIGFTSKIMKSSFVEILEFSRRDCSFILFPVGFSNLQRTEKTLCMLYYGSYTILSCATLAIQREVFIISMKDFKFSKNFNKITFVLMFTLLFFVFSFFISTKNSKDIIWFLSFTISDNGRILVALLICIVLGWLYNIEYQYKRLTSRSVLVFNITYWILNIFFSILFNYLPYHAYILYIIRIVIFIFSTCISIIVLKSQINEMKGKQRQIHDNLTYKEILYILYLGNIECLRKEIQRIISGNAIIGNITMMWSICIKYIGTSILLSALIEYVDGVFYSTELRMKIHDIHYGWVVFAILVWVFIFLFLFLFPMFTKTFENMFINKDYFVNFSLLPSKPLTKIQHFNIFSYFYEFGNSTKKKE